MLNSIGALERFDASAIQDSLDFSLAESFFAIERAKSDAYLQQSLGIERKQETKLIKLYNNPSECCGCGSCVDACPKRAITMAKGQKQEYLPVIDETSCIKCGICLNVCGLKKSARNHTEAKHAYIGRGVNENLLKNQHLESIFYNSREIINMWLFMVLHYRLRITWPYANTLELITSMTFKYIEFEVCTKQYCWYI